MTLLNAGRWELTPGETRLYNENFYAGGNRCTSQSGTVFDSASAVMACDTTVTSAAAAYLFYSDDKDELFWHFKFQFDAAPDSASLDYWVFGFGYGFASVQGLYLVLHSDDAVNTTLQLQIGGSQSFILHDGQALSAATSYRFEVRMKNLSPGDATGIWLYQVKLDSALLWTGFVRNSDIGTGAYITAWRFGRDTAGTAIGTIGLNTAFTMNDTAGSVNNKWPGSVTFNSLTPDAAGSNLAYTAWTNTFTAVDESPTASDQIFTTVAGNKEAWTLSTATVSGIRAVVYAWDAATVRVAGAAPSVTVGNKLLVWDGAEFASVEFTFESGLQFTSAASVTHAYGVKGMCYIMETQPSDASAWDQTTIDALESGISSITHSDANWRNITYAHRMYVITGAEGPEADDIRPLGATYFFQPGVTTVV